ncbi:hypothetical protein ABEB36_015604 [Hypothenemus hampei]|uniref:Integrase catalytic domain-containing protein n=1 Tax=Hypothenemus hampei TaxID=57062 RepID=A0ABD1E146_HYPHA
MSIDKFGAHISNKDIKTITPTTDDQINKNNIHFVDIRNVKLNYNLILPFIGEYILRKEAYALLQDKRIKYDFPLISAVIIKTEYPEEVFLKLKNKPVKTKSAKHVTAAIKSVIDEVKEYETPKNLQTDMGKEFFNMEFRK